MCIDLKERFRTPLTEESARSALLGGAGGIASFTAVAATVFITVSVVRCSALMGIDVWSLVDSSLIAFLGYKMYSGNLWAAAALLVYYVGNPIWISGFLSTGRYCGL